MNASLSLGQMGDIELFLEQRYACELSARNPVNLQDSLTRDHAGWISAGNRVNLQDFFTRGHFGGVSPGNHVNLQDPLSSPISRESCEFT